MLANPFSLADRRILVTGAYSGIGRETAILLSHLGAHLVLVGRDQIRLNETLGRLEPGAHRAHRFDLNDPDSIPSWLKQIAIDGGMLNGFVHSAGVHETVPIRALNSRNIESLFRINVVSGMMILKGFRQKGVSEGARSAVFVSSVAGLKGEAAISSYSASKAALIGMVRSSAIELARENIRVNCVAPSVVITSMASEMRETLGEEQFAAIESRHPLGLGTPEDVGMSIAFLLSDAAKWITGTTLVVDGGYSAQ